MNWVSAPLVRFICLVLIQDLRCLQGSSKYFWYSYLKARQQLHQRTTIQNSKFHRMPVSRYTIIHTIINRIEQWGIYQCPVVGLLGTCGSWLTNPCSYCGSNCVTMFPKSAVETCFSVRSIVYILFLVGHSSICNDSLSFLGFPDIWDLPRVLSFTNASIHVVPSGPRGWSIHKNLDAAWVPFTQLSSFHRVLHCHLKFCIFAVLTIRTGVILV